MRVLVLGGTGSIGTGVTSALVAESDEVLALTRSERSAARIRTLGASPIPGDIRDPEAWVPPLPRVDAIVHAACDYAPDMGAVDDRLLDALLPVLATWPKKPRFIYTGGCWLYGATGDTVAVEETPFDPLPAFAWMIPNLRRVLASDAVHGLVVHPAMVHTDAGGVFARFAADAVSRPAVRVVGGPEVRWPLIHTEDLGSLYAAVVHRGIAGASYNAVAVDGVPVGAIARAFATRFGTARRDPEVVEVATVVAELGEWARGYALDQQMSGDKARRELGWVPSRLDPLDPILRLPL
jgi:nucleoside-diphosphate-sugar epimerase